MTAIVIDIDGSRDLEILDFSVLGEYKIITIPDSYRTTEPIDLNPNISSIEQYLAEQLGTDSTKISFIVYLVKNKGHRNVYDCIRVVMDKTYKDVPFVILAEKLKLAEEPLYTDAIYYYIQQKEYEQILKETLYTGKPITREVVDELLHMAKTENTIPVSKAMETLRYKKPVVANFYNAWGLLWNINK